VQTESVARSDDDFDELFVREFDRCTRVARRVVRQEELARDLAAEAFVRAWARWPSLRTQQPGAWVVKVTVNLAIDATRVRIPLVSAPRATTTSVEAKVEQLVIADALRQLSERQRTAVVLRYLADYTEDEVAAALGVSKGTVKVHLHRGTRRLRRVLGEW
jgi:RNA polymerase sigma factor (sigma-70 family)